MSCADIYAAISLISLSRKSVEFCSTLWHTSTIDLTEYYQWPASFTCGAFGCAERLLLCACQHVEYKFHSISATLLVDVSFVRNVMFCMNPYAVETGNKQNNGA